MLSRRGQVSSCASLGDDLAACNTSYRLQGGRAAHGVWVADMVGGYCNACYGNIATVLATRAAHLPLTAYSVTMQGGSLHTPMKLYRQAQQQQDWR